MKLKTLLLVVAILCVSLFVVACGGDDTTAANEDPTVTTTAAETTVATTTKATTTKKTTTATTTVAATTIPTDLIAKLPSKLPDNSTFEIGVRVGFESENDFLTVNGNFANSEFTATNALYGNAFKFSSITSREGSARRGEAYIDHLDPFTPEGIKGLMWYIDFSDVTRNPDGSHGLCTSITFNTNSYRSNLGGAGAAKGYYYKDGAWVETKNVNACRMEVPDGFKGFVYVPLTSYGGAGDLYDATTGIGLGNVFAQNFRVYTDGYTYTDDHFVLIDELLYVK